MKTRQDLYRRFRQAIHSFNTPISIQDRFPQHEIGRGTYADENLVIRTWAGSADLRIGSFCSFGPGVQLFLGGEHRPDWVTTYPFNVFLDSAAQITGHPATKGDMVIGNDVWIGAEAMILSGVSVGDGAVIGARAVVARDVPAYGVVAGNPAVLIRSRFPPDVVSRLLRIRWWDWPDEKIARFMPLLLQPEIELFLAAAERMPE